MMEEIPVRVGSERFVWECREPQADCRNKDAGGTPALPGGIIYKKTGNMVYILPANRARRRMQPQEPQ